MKTTAVVLETPERLALAALELTSPGPSDAVVDIAYSGISTGTERLLYCGRMPAFPGMGYPLVPGYESVGRVTQAGEAAGVAVGAPVFVPGANCYGPVRGLFGGAASRVVVPGSRLLPVDASLGERAVLLALAATAQHALTATESLPELIVGHGVLGRLLARLAVQAGGAPMVWETNAARRGGAAGYAVVDPTDDARRDYRVICDVSGDAAVLDTLVARLATGGAIVLAGFYSERLGFAFPPAFMREARLLIAAQWQRRDLDHVAGLIASGALSLDGLITHRSDAADAPAAYRTAFGEPDCLKMILDWSACA